MEDDLVKKIKSLNLENEVSLIHAVDPKLIPKLLSNSDLFVLPSIVDSQGETETLGVVFIEAMASGLPVIGTRVGGIVDVIVDGKTGFFVEQKSPEDLAKKIILLLNSPARMRIMAKNARKRAETHFDWNQIIERYLQVINSLVRKKSDNS